MCASRGHCGPMRSTTVRPNPRPSEDPPRTVQTLKCQIRVSHGGRFAATANLVAAVGDFEPQHAGDRTLFRPTKSFSSCEEAQAAQAALPHIFSGPAGPVLARAAERCAGVRVPSICGYASARPIRPSLRVEIEDGSTAATTTISVCAALPARPNRQLRPQVPRQELPTSIASRFAGRVRSSR